MGLAKLDIYIYIAELLGFGGRGIQLQTLVGEAWPDVKLAVAELIA